MGSEMCIRDRYLSLSVLPASLNLFPVNATVRETLSANATEGQQIMYDFMDKVSKFKMPDKVNVLSPDGQDEVVDNYRNYIQQVVDGQITAEEAAQKTYDDAAALFTE